MTAYYNENDPKAAKRLKECISSGLIAPGDVDERSIRDVSPVDFVGFAQVHLFAGTGAWSAALRLAGWPDDRPVWTGSCPCQPFSSAGKRKGFKDKRHLWPEMFRLARKLHPQTILGEQVAGTPGYGWFDLVADDLEREDYACWAVDFPACSVGAYHKRQRLYWLANSYRPGLERSGQAQPAQRGCDSLAARASQDNPLCRGCYDSEYAHNPRCKAVGQADSNGSRLEECQGFQIYSRQERKATFGSCWADVEWIECGDGKHRPIKPGIRPLAYGIPRTVARAMLREFGNSIVIPQAAAFIQAVAEII